MADILFSRLCRVAQVHLIRRARAALLPALLAALCLSLLLAPAAPAFAQETLPSTVYATRDVFMRAGPSLLWRVLATIPGGEQLTVQDQYTNWFKVSRSDGTVGWVSGSYLSLDPPGPGGLPGAPIFPRPPDPGSLATVTTPVLNVRSGPGLNFPPIGTAKGGELVTVLAKNLQWRLVQTAGGLQGWVNSLYLSGALGPAFGVPAGGGITTVGTLAGSLMIRSIIFDHAVRDARREGGAIVTMRIEFVGGAGPYTITSDGGFLKGSGLVPLTRPEGSIVVGTLYFTELAECSGTMVHTIALQSTAGESDIEGYFVGPVICPN